YLHRQHRSPDSKKPVSGRRAQRPYPVVGRACGMHFSTATTRGAEGIPSEVLWSKNKLRRGTTISSKPIVLGALTGGTHQLDRCSILRNCSGARRIGRIARIVYRCYLRAIQSSRRASS